VAGRLDLDAIVQRITDAATSLTGAQFGAFFYNVLREDGEAYTLYTISGVPRSHFEKFPMPRNTAVFAPTFAGEGIVRSANILKDPRYGHNAPNKGMPSGHLPVVSYLAVPVISHTGEVLGGLFFGHPTEDVFGETEEKIVEALAGHAAVAIDNVRLYERLERDRAALRKEERRYRSLAPSNATRRRGAPSPASRPRRCSGAAGSTWFIRSIASASPRHGTPRSAARACSATSISAASRTARTAGSRPRPCRCTETTASSRNGSRASPTSTSSAWRRKG
jgi:hypothetical protein